MDGRLSILPKTREEIARPTSQQTKHQKPRLPALKGTPKQWPSVQGRALPIKQMLARIPVGITAIYIQYAG